MCLVPDPLWAQLIQKYKYIYSKGLVRGKDKKIAIMAHSLLLLMQVLLK